MNERPGRRRGHSVRLLLCAWERVCVCVWCVADRSACREAEESQGKEFSFLFVRWCSRCNRRRRQLLLCFTCESSSTPFSRNRWLSYTLCPPDSCPVSSSPAWSPSPRRSDQIRISKHTCPRLQDLIARTCSSVYSLSSLVLWCGRSEVRCCRRLSLFPSFPLMIAVKTGCILSLKGIRDCECNDECEKKPETMHPMPDHQAVDVSKWQELLVAISVIHFSSQWR